MQKENKRCIPKEGMPHASACQKERKKEKMHTQRRYATCLGMSKKRKKKKIAPYPKRKKKRDGAYKGIHTPSTKKNIHTLAHLDQGF